MSTSIRHIGTITAVGDNKVTVTITPSSDDCNGCAISQLCSQKETIEVFYNNPSQDLLGKHATIAISSRSQSRAVSLMLAAPIMLLVASMLALVACGVSEAVSALSSLALVAIWYLVIYLTTRRSTAGQSVSITSIDT